MGQAQPQTQTGGPDVPPGGQSYPGSASASMAESAGFNTEGQEQQSNFRRHGFAFRSSRYGSSMSIRGIFSSEGGLSDSDDDQDSKSWSERWCPWLYSRKQRRGPCYYCFVLVFLGFAIIFPLFLKWLVTSPVPSQYWNEAFDEFPAVLDKDFLKDGEGFAYNMSLSDIPATFFGCNHSCIGASGGSGFTSEVSFPVDMTLDAPDFQHSAFPVLLASNDFNTWYVAADRRDSLDTPFFPSHNNELADVYLHTTDMCTRVPEVTDQFAEIRKSIQSDDSFTSQPIYVLACIAWDKEDIDWHANVTDLIAADVSSRCQAVGGVCGWPCGSNPQSNDLPFCSEDGIISVSNSEVAGVTLPGADFRGNVSVLACHDGPTTKCTTTANPMSEWPCHKCAVTSVMYGQVDPNSKELGNKTYQVRYDSLPRMEVYLKNIKLTQTDAIPRVFLMTSSVDPQNRGPAGMHDGVWRKLYSSQSGLVSDPFQQPAPVPLSILEAAYPNDAETTNVVGLPPGLPEEVDIDAYVTHPSLVDTEKFKMRFLDKTKLTLAPGKCFAARGALYLVACAVNESTYKDGFELRRGQSVAPPPFNDRCLTVRGRCGYACMSQQTPALAHCSAEGVIPNSELVEPFEIPQNESAVVFVFMFAMLFGFAVKLMTYFPGLFTPDSHPQHYSLKQTEKFKYVAVVTPSGGETKACCVRNIVGAISALPVGCQCPYHVVFADEGHRHPQKVCFIALVKVLDCVPEVRMRRGPSTDRHIQRRARATGHFKEENLKAFTKLWVQSTRTLTLNKCETSKMSAKLKTLDEKRDKEEIKKINDTIDRLCGLEALKQLNVRMGWPSPESNDLVAALQKAIYALRAEFCVPEKEFVNDMTGEAAKALQQDDCRAFSWRPSRRRGIHADSAPDSGINSVLYTLHYVARAKPDEDERTLKVQHVARGVWYYKIPKDRDVLKEKNWLEWRARAQVYQDGDNGHSWNMVPLRTSRGKAGGLNFVENYLYDYTQQIQEKARIDPSEPTLKHALFSIADARHQFQPDFFHETIPYFFKQNNHELDPKVAFTQSPQYFPEMPDDIDYLDTNNANFFRLNCMLRNCCGGVSSCGTNGTWLVKDRKPGTDMWEDEEILHMELFSERRERRFFHESCKVEDTASSLDRVVRGKYSRYVPVRLSYGMAKDPTDYLAAVQRWAEGGVVLSLQTFLSCGEGIHMIWISLCIFILFVLSVANIVYGWGYTFWLDQTSLILTGDSGKFHEYFLASAEYFADLAVDTGSAEGWFREVWIEMFLEVQIWLCVVVAFIVVLWFITTISYYLHNPPCYAKVARRTRFPTSMAQWARLAITLDNLTYFLWFWTAFFWVFFNYYGIWARRWYHFEANGMVLFTYLLQVFGWSLVITSASRFTTEMGNAASEVFFLSLTNVWRTTQLFYIIAPLTAYSIIMGFSDFARNRMLDVDISYWIGGDRGAVSKSIAQWWTLLLIVGAIVSHIFFWLNLLPHASVGGLLIVTFIALDVMHPCAFLWLGPAQEKLPDPPGQNRPSWQRCPLRILQLLFSLAYWKNMLRSIIFNPRSTTIVKWIGPVQNVLFPLLTWFFPELGVNQALLLLTSSRV